MPGVAERARRACGCPSPRSPGRGSRRSAARPAARGRVAAGDGLDRVVEHARPVARPRQRLLVRARDRRRHREHHVGRVVRELQVPHATRSRDTTAPRRARHARRRSPSCCAGTAASSRGACARARPRAVRPACSTAALMPCTAWLCTTSGRNVGERAVHVRPASGRATSPAWKTSRFARGCDGVLGERVAPRPDLRDDVVAATPAVSAATVWPASRRRSREGGGVELGAAEHLGWPEAGDHQHPQDAVR